MVYSASLESHSSLVDELKLIPGVWVREQHGRVYLSATPDVAPLLERQLGIVIPRRRVRPRNWVEPTLDLSLLSSKLQPWQREGAQRLAADDIRCTWFACGLGKTATVLSALRLLNVRRALVVTRAMGRDAWARDSVWAWPGATVSIISGAQPRADKRSKAQEHSIRHADARLADLRALGAVANVYGSALDDDCTITVVGWETLRCHLAQLKSIRWDRLVLDESHCVKNYRADRTDAVKDLARGIPITWLVTATPVRDRLRDLGTQLSLMCRAAWSDWTFVHRYSAAMPGKFGGLDTTGKSNTAELKKRLEYWAMFKTRDEVMHLLPSKTRNLIRMPPDGVRFAPLYEHGPRGIEAQIAYAAGVKTGEVIERAKEALIGGEKIAIIGNRLKWAPMMSAHVEEAVPARVRKKLWSRIATGESSVGDRQALAREFMRVKGPAVLVATIDSVSESIDLHDADRVIVAALPYTPGQLTQMEGRFHRLGQKRPVVYDYLIAQGTIDEVIEDNLLGKLNAIEEAGLATEVWERSEESEAEVMAQLRSWLNEKGAVAERAVAEEE